MNSTHYRWNEYTKTHEHHLGHCLWCNNRISETQGLVVVSKNLDKLQVSYCSKKCQFEDPNYEAYIDKFTSLCQKYQEAYINEKDEEKVKKKIRFERKLEEYKLKSRAFILRFTLFVSISLVSLYYFSALNVFSVFLLFAVSLIFIALFKPNKPIQDLR
jgi:hypothetical protein